jgi:hypothetical protein
MKKKYKAINNLCGGGEVNRAGTKDCGAFQIVFWKEIPNIV